MPNLRLNASEIQALLTYIEEESRRKVDAGPGIRPGQPK
jgi:hypothetical protein